MDFKSELLHGGAKGDAETGALSVPIFSASTYNQKDPSKRQAYDYSRSGNPTRASLEEYVAALERGHSAFAFASGMAAIGSVLTGLLSAGDHLVAPLHLYGGTHRFITQFLKKFAVNHSFADFRSVESVKAAIRPETKVILIETPSNPLMQVTDIKAVIALAKSRGIYTVFDNTFLTPLLFRPIEHGADVVVHSATKFLGGHSDLIAGIATAANKEVASKIYFVQNGFGAVLSPENSWTLIRGIKTLSARLNAEEQSARIIAEELTKRKYIAEVRYPGLVSHEGHELLKSYSSGFGAVLSFRVDSMATLDRIIKNVKLMAVAVSLGGVESILSWPAKMSHAAIPAAERAALGITDDWLRLSVGLEAPEDLLKDLDTAAV
ncbi:MAG: PLP-dependent transferase [Fibrobacteres bacterium]|nr:PLP-dependent transferase [Fibrobacterota bacterium]